MGYPFGTKGYKVLNLTTKRLHISRDVVFHENVFPFSLSSHQPVLPDVVPLTNLNVDASHSSVTPHSFDTHELDFIQSSHNATPDPIRAGNSPSSPSSPQSTTSPSSSHNSLPDPQPHISQPQAEPRRLSRTHATPTYLKEYSYSLPNLQPSSSSVSASTNIATHTSLSLTSFSLDSQQLIRNISLECESSSYEEAILNPAWQVAMTQEFEALYANHTWDLVPFPAGKRTIGCRWVYKVKHKVDGSIESFKARLVMKGYTQKHGVDSSETFSPVVKMTTIRILQSLAIKKGWKLHQLDVNNAFLHGDLHEEVYMNPPKGILLDNPNLVCKLRKSLYGLKQASRQWYEKMVESLCLQGYVHSGSDYYLFYKKTDGSTVFVAVYVDDVIVTGTDEKEIHQLKLFLQKFKIKDLGHLHYFLGLEVLYRHDRI